MMRPLVAVLDDERRLADVLTMVLARDGYEVETFYSPGDFFSAQKERAFDLLLTDLKMPEVDGVEVLRRARERDPHLPVILITAHATLETAIAAIREGAFDYIEKPVENDVCRRLVARALEVHRLSRENRYLRRELKTRYAVDNLVAQSEGMSKALELAVRAARSQATVLIQGESGTGKELVARVVHVHSDRVAGPFVAVNCKSFAPGVLESELFGHVKGAFTGAHQSRPGVFERASGGTLFLDEVGEIDLDFQGKLLRALQERIVLPLGGSEDRPVNARLVAATNRDLPAEVEAGRFRQDLYFRLAVVPITLPPLRERRSDVVPLAQHFLDRCNEEQGRRITGWDDDVMRYLGSHDFPGNVRELENLIERGVVLAQGDVLTLDDLLVDSPGQVGGDAPGASELTLSTFLDQAAAARIRTVLLEVGGKRAEAAKVLGIERTTLYRLMKRLKIADCGQ